MIVVSENRKVQTFYCDFSAGGKKIRNKGGERYSCQMNIGKSESVNEKISIKVRVK